MSKFAAVFVCGGLASTGCVVTHPQNACHISGSVRQLSAAGWPHPVGSRVAVIRKRRLPSAGCRSALPVMCKLSACILSALLCLLSRKRKKSFHAFGGINACGRVVSAAGVRFKIFRPYPPQQVGCSLAVRFRRYIQWQAVCIGAAVLLLGSCCAFVLLCPLLS